MLTDGAKVRGDERSGAGAHQASGPSARADEGSAGSHDVSRHSGAARPSSRTWSIRGWLIAGDIIALFIGFVLRDIDISDIAGFIPAYGLDGRSPAYLGELEVDLIGVEASSLPLHGGRDGHLAAVEEAVEFDIDHHGEPVVGAVERLRDDDERLAEAVGVELGIRGIGLRGLANRGKACGEEVGLRRGAVVVGCEGLVEVRRGGVVNAPLDAGCRLGVGNATGIALLRCRIECALLAIIGREGAGALVIDILQGDTLDDGGDGLAVHAADGTGLELDRSEGMVEEDGVALTGGGCGALADEGGGEGMIDLFLGCRVTAPARRDEVIQMDDILAPVRTAVGDRGALLAYRGAQGIVEEEDERRIVVRPALVVREGMAPNALVVLGEGSGTNSTPDIVIDTLTALVQIGRGIEVAKILRIGGGTAGGRDAALYRERKTEEGRTLPIVLLAARQQQRQAEGTTDTEDTIVVRFHTTFMLKSSHPKPR